MYRYLLFLLIFISQILMANEQIEVRLRAKQIDEKLKVKSLINANIVIPETAERNKIPLYYIPSLIVKADDNTLATAYLSPYFNGFVGFDFLNNTHIDKINLLIKDSNGQLVKKSKHVINALTNTINNDSNKSLKNFKIPKSDIFKSINSNDAIKAFYGSTQTHEGNFTIKFAGDYLIKLDDGMCSTNGGRLSIRIQLNLKLNSLAIFQDSNKYSTIAIFHDTQSSIDYYKLAFKMRKTSIIRVVGRGVDGLLYESKSKMYIIPGSHRDCYGKLSGPYMRY